MWKPLIQTSLLAMTPSKSMKTRRPAYFAGSEKYLRYQPTPAGRKPPAPPVGFFSSKGPSILHSCGKSSFRKAPSSKSAFSAPGASPLRKRQSLSKEEVTRVYAADPADVAGAIESGSRPTISESTSQECANVLLIMLPIDKRYKSKPIYFGAEAAKPCPRSHSAQRCGHVERIGSLPPSPNP